MKNFLIVIPARLGSTRLPGKVLADLGGRPVVEWCRRAALAAGLGPVVVATDSAEVRRALEPFGAEVAMTPAACASGSDRVWAAADRREYRGFRHIINLQGDAPFLKAATLRRVARALRLDPEADIATAVVRVESAEQAADPNLVKAAVAKDGRCLYFSRAPIPWSAAAGTRAARAEDGARAAASWFWGHLGIYAYRRQALRRFTALPPSGLERRERLEQLRALEAGMRVVAASARDSLLAIDTPEDLERARRRLFNG